jgi:hypothetical protein
VEQVFLDNFIKQLKEVVDELRSTSNVKQSKNAVNEAAPSIINRDEQQVSENKVKGQGEIVSIDNKSVENIIKKFKDAFKSDKEKEQKEQNDYSIKMLSKLDGLAKSSDETAKAQKQQAEQEDINKLTQRDDVKKFYIAGIDKSVIKELIDVFSNKGPQNDKPFDFMSLLGGLGLLAGGSELAFGSDIGSGISQIGKLAVKLGEKIVRKTLKKIKSLVSFVFSNKGFEALKSVGDTIFKLPAALFDILPDSIKGSLKEAKDKIFKSLSDAFDIGKELIKKIPGANTIKTFLKSLGGMFGDILKYGLKLFKFIPGLGDIINLYFAYEKFTNGDYIGSLVELAGAIPGFGIIADFYSLYRDFTYTDKEKAAQNKSLGLTDFFDNIGKKFSTIWEKIKNMPLFKGINDIIDGIGMIKNGNFAAGLRMIGKGAFNTSPVGVIFDAAASVYEWASSLINSGEQEADAPVSMEIFKIEKFDFVGTIKNALAAKIEAMKSFVKKIVSKPVEWAKSMWKSVEGYFSTAEELQAEKAADAESMPDFKPNNKANVAVAAQLSNEALKILFEDLKKTQVKKADAQLKAITITNDILMRIEKAVNAIGYSSSNAQKQSKEMQANDYNVFPLQYTATQIRQQMLAGGYA